MTGDDLRAAIIEACSLTNPRLSEVDWDAVALAAADRAERGLPPCQHEACAEVYDSDTPASAPVIAIAWALAERSADGPHGSNERRRFRSLARAFLQDLLRDPRRASAVRDFLAARLAEEDAG